MNSYQEKQAACHKGWNNCQIVKQSSQLLNIYLQFVFSESINSYTEVILAPFISLQVQSLSFSVYLEA